MKCLASLPNGSAGTSTIDPEDAASLCADVKGARGPAAESPFCSLDATSLVITASAAALLPGDGAYLKTCYILSQFGK